MYKKYFPELSELQCEKLLTLEKGIAEWNEKINLISRKDTEHIAVRHVLHSPAIAKVIKFQSGSLLVDIGTGGGFPGLPLAIMFPDVEFILTDSISKKIMVVNDLKERLALVNVEARASRVESIKVQADFMISRAVAPLDTLSRWSMKLISKKEKNQLPNGILCLKGGDFKAELKPFGRRAICFPISTYFKEEFFETKQVVYLQN